MRRTTCRRSGSEKYKGRFAHGWDELRQDHLRPPEGPRCRPRGRRADSTSGRRDPGLGRDARRAEAGLQPARWRVYAGFLEHTDHHHRTADRRVRGARDPRTTRSIYVHHRRQRRLRRGHAQRLVQRDDATSTGRQRWRRPSSWPRASTSSVARGLQPLRRRLGARDGHAVSSGQSRSPRTGVVRATARSSTGPGRHRDQRRGTVSSSTT